MKLEPADIPTIYHYDSAGRMDYTVDPLLKPTYSFYDYAGQLTRIQDANGHNSCYEYDLRGRQVGVYYNDDTSCSHTSNATVYAKQEYDAAGRIWKRWNQVYAGQTPSLQAMTGRLSRFFIPMVNHAKNEAKR